MPYFSTVASYLQWSFYKINKQVESYRMLLFWMCSAFDLQTVLHLSFDAFQTHQYSSVTSKAIK